MIKTEQQRNERIISWKGVKAFCGNLKFDTFIHLFSSQFYSYEICATNPRTETTFLFTIPPPPLKTDETGHRIVKCYKVRQTSKVHKLGD